MGQETDRGRSLSGCFMDTSGTLPCCLAFFLLRPTEDSPPLETSPYPKAWLPHRLQGAHTKCLPSQVSPQPGRHLARSCLINLDMVPCRTASGAYVQAASRGRAGDSAVATAPYPVLPAPGHQATHDLGLTKAPLCLQAPDTPDSSNLWPRGERLHVSGAVSDSKHPPSSPLLIFLHPVLPTLTQSPLPVVPPRSDVLLAQARKEKGRGV